MAIGPAASATLTARILGGLAAGAVVAGRAVVGGAVVAGRVVVGATVAAVPSAAEAVVDGAVVAVDDTVPTALVPVAAGCPLPPHPATTRRLTAATRTR
jgi:hypothetical protein